MAHFVLMYNHWQWLHQIQMSFILEHIQQASTKRITGVQHGYIVQIITFLRMKIRLVILRHCLAGGTAIIIQLMLLPLIHKMKIIFG